MKERRDVLEKRMKAEVEFLIFIKNILEFF